MRFLRMHTDTHGTVSFLDQDIEAAIEVRYSADDGAWAHIALAYGRERPAFAGFVPLEAALLQLAERDGVEGEDGMSTLRLSPSNPEHRAALELIMRTTSRRMAMGGATA